MTTPSPDYNSDFRQDVLAPLFRFVENAESFYVIAAASMGKTRLMDYLMLPETQTAYLKDTAGRTWLVRVDMNRLPEKTPFHFYELLISSMVLTAAKYDHPQLMKELTQLDSDVITGKDFLMALRYFELSVSMLCQQENLAICFLFDEFDSTYQSLQHEILSQLRAVRDMNKKRLCFGLFLRNLPERLRTAPESESFYELFSRNAIGMGPYNRADALKVIDILERRRAKALQEIGGYPLGAPLRERFVAFSGGHPGLIQALLGLFTDRPEAWQQNLILDLDWLFQQQAVLEECEKLWRGLLDEEQDALRLLLRIGPEAVDGVVHKLLTAKGIIRGERQLFSPLFAKYVAAR